MSAPELKPYPNLPPHLRHQAQTMDVIFDSLARPARRVASNPDKPAQPPDLIAEVEQCATELAEAANLIEPSFPRVATLFQTAARRARAKAALAREASA